MTAVYVSIGVLAGLLLLAAIYFFILNIIVTRRMNQDPFLNSLFLYQAKIEKKFIDHVNNMP